MRLVYASIFTLFLSTPLQAHDIYHGIMQPNGLSIPCCSGHPVHGDCRPVIPQTRNGITYFDGHPFNPSRVVGSPDERYHICEKRGIVFCIMIPPGT